MRCRVMFVVLIGCGGGTSSHPDGGGSGGDAGNGGDGGTPVTCAMPSVHDTFDSGPPCTGWGTAQMNNAAVALAAGKLVVTPGASGSSFGGCFTTIPQPLSDFGFFVALAAPGTSTAEITKLQIQDPGAGNAQWSITYAGGMVSFANINEQVATRAASAGPQWWRIHPDAGRTALVAETSPDGHLWTVLGTSPTAIPSTVTVTFGAGSFSPTMPPAAASFESFDVCP